MKSLKSLFKRQKLIYLIVTACCMLLHIVDWSNSINPPTSEHVKYAVILVLLIALPFYPLITSSFILATCIVFYGSTDSYWLSSYPFLLSITIIAFHWGKIATSLIFIAAAQSLLILEQISPFVVIKTAIEGIPYILQPISMAWCVGTLLRYGLNQARQQSIMQEKEAQRKNQLALLHILHDSIANDLVYAILEIRKLNSQSNESQNNYLSSVTETLESVLEQLRSQVILPLREQVFQSEQCSSDIQIIQSTPATRIRRTNLTIARQLHECGFKGHPQFIGDANGLDTAHVLFIINCIRELGGNILKHGSPEEYALSVEITDDSIIVLSSNRVSTDQMQMNQHQSGNGLTLLRNDIYSFGGLISYAIDGNEWTIYIEVPTITTQRS